MQQIVTAPRTAPDRLFLRDGSVAAVRVATVADCEAVRRFYSDLSPESRRLRFLGVATPAAVIDRLCDSSDPSQGVTLLAVRELTDGSHVIAVCSYVAVNSSTAEVAFAVDDRFQGRGIATAMLERLARLAERNGFQWFEATTSAENAAMLEVFRDSGFEVRSRTTTGEVRVRLSVTPSPEGVYRIDERDRVATLASLRPLLEPTSVAVIGVSRRTEAIGRRIYEAIHRSGFTGRIYAVNHTCDDVDGRPCFRSARQLPSGVDLAVIAVPPEQVLPAIDDCGARGVHAVLIVTAGFAETGSAGAALQRQVLERARAYGMRVVGPNCIGLINTNPRVRLNASFIPGVPPAGRIAFASQSGGLGIALMEMASARQLGISTFVSLGNKADVSGNDLLQFGESDPGTSTILLYLESFGNPRRFAQLARRIARRKPIVVVKAGRTQAGARAAGSHTAGLASNDAAVEALFSQCGVIRAGSIDEMFDVAMCLDEQPLPAGPRLAIVTNAGGPGILAADACERAGLTVVELSDATRSTMAARLPGHASPANPLDLIASAGPTEYAHAVELMLAADEVDALLVIHSPVESSTRAATLAAIGDAVAAARESGNRKPVYVCTMSLGATPLAVSTGSERLPAFTFPETAVRALGRVVKYARWRAEPDGLLWGFDDVRADQARAICRHAVSARGTTWLTSEEVSQVLTAFALPEVDSHAVASGKEAAAVATRVGYPVVLKVLGPDILHKTERGAVAIDLANATQVENTFARLATDYPAAMTPGSGTSIVLQPMILHATELLVGATADPLFGPLVAVGLGGINAELVRDVGFRVAPITDKDADTLLRSLRSYPLLNGYRGRPPADVDAVRDVLMRLSALVTAVPEILELDFNPLMVLAAPHGCRIVDARIRVGPAAWS